MATPISGPQQPHGYSSQIGGPSDQLPLPNDLKTILHKIIDVLHRIKDEAHHIKEEAQQLHSTVANLVEQFKQFDDQHTDLLAESNKHSDRALESHVKNTYKTEFFHFAHKLKDIVNTEDPH